MTKNDLKQKITEVDCEYKKVSQKINDMKRDIHRLTKDKTRLEDELYKYKVALGLYDNECK